MTSDFPVVVQSETLNKRIDELRSTLIGQGRMGDAAQVIANESRLAVKQIIALTPPRSKAQGEAAIERDLEKIFTPVSDELLNVIGSTHGLNSIDAWITTADDKPKHLNWRHIDPTGSGMESFHKANRNRRGRTRNLKPKMQGIWAAPYVVSFEDFKAYLAKVQARVGRRKAAWAKSLKALGGTVAGWIDRHTSTADGRTDNRLNDQFRPSIAMASSAPGVADDKRIIDAVMKIRANAITKKIKSIIDGYSQDMAAGRSITRKEQPLMADAA